MKTCKPNYRTQYFEGCGEEKQIFKYGACQSCFIKWATTTEDGKKWHAKQTAYKMRDNEKKERVKSRAEKREMKIQLMSTSKYWSDVFQPKFNELIRIIDKGSGCIATRRTTGQMQAGHYVHAGVNKTISINAHNIFLQSMESNHFQSGDILKYQDGLKIMFGENYFNFIQRLKRCPALHLTKIELIDYYKIVLRLRRDYKKENYEFLSPLERIEMRNDINLKLGIYPKEFLVYDSTIKY